MSAVIAFIVGVLVALLGLFGISEFQDNKGAHGLHHQR